MRLTVPCLSLFLLSCASTPKFLTNDVSWKEYSTPPAMGAVTFPQCIATDHDLMVFGGIREGSTVPSNNQGFSFDLDRGRWQAWPTDAGPRALQNYATAWTPKGFFVFGGVADKPYADAFLYEMEKRSWRPLPDAAKLLNPRSQASATVVGNKVIVFGGLGRQEKLNAATLDLESLKFEPLLMPPTLSSRAAHVAKAIGNKLFIWGGFQGGKRKNDGFLYDVLDQTWTPLPASPLSARANAKSVVVDARIYIFGGMADGKQAQDGAQFNLETMSWENLPWIPDPAFKDLYGFEAVSVGRQGLLLTGGRFSENEFNQQPWYFEFKSKSWRKVLALNPPPGSIAHCVARNEKGTIFVLGGMGQERGNGLKQFEGLHFLPL